MTPDDAWVYAIIPFVTMAVLTFGVVVVVRQRAASRRHAGLRRTFGADAARPWWGSPWLWIGITVVAVFLGAFVWVGLLRDRARGGAARRAGNGPPAARPWIPARTDTRIGTPGRSSRSEHALDEGADQPGGLSLPPPEVVVRARHDRRRRVGERGGVGQQLLGGAKVSCSPARSSAGRRNARRSVASGSGGSDRSFGHERKSDQHQRRRRAGHRSRPGSRRSRRRTSPPGSSEGPGRRRRVRARSPRARRAARRDRLRRCRSSPSRRGS